MQPHEWHAGEKVELAGVRSTAALIRCVGNIGRPNSIGHVAEHDNHWEPQFRLRAGLITAREGYPGQSGCQFTSDVFREFGLQTLESDPPLPNDRAPGFHRANEFRSGYTVAIRFHESAEQTVGRGRASGLRVVLRRSRRADQGHTPRPHLDQPPAGQAAIGQAHGATIYL